MNYQYYIERRDGLKYCVQNDHGYLENLVSEIGESLVNEFIVLGFIYTGYTLEKETWGINPLGKRYYEMVKPD